MRGAHTSRTSFVSTGATEDSLTKVSKNTLYIVRPVLSVKASPVINNGLKKPYNKLFESLLNGLVRNLVLAGCSRNGEITALSHSQMTLEAWSLIMMVGDDFLLEGAVLKQKEMIGTFVEWIRYSSASRIELPGSKQGSGTDSEMCGFIEIFADQHASPFPHFHLYDNLSGYFNLQ